MGTLARRLALPLAAIALLGAHPAESQQRRCDLIDQGRNARTEQVEMGGMTIINFHDPFLVRCTDGTELRANRGTLNQTLRELQLWGDVFFEDPIRALTADEATYNSGIGRLHARGNVVFRNLEEGSTIRGPELEYFSATERRPQAQVHARQRPHLTLQPREQGDDAEPLEIDADEVTIVGQDQLSAAGSVVITRTDMVATSREAQYDGATGGLELRGGSAIASRDYDLAGDVIQAQTDDGVLRHVHARTNASLEGEELTVTAPDLQLFFEDELLQSAVARTVRGAGDDDQPEQPRAVATSRTFRLEADSIDARLPGQRVERVVAIGTARGESIDSLEARVAQQLPDDTIALERQVAGNGLTDRDWIRGDTITGYFSTPTAEVEAEDTTAVLERIVAQGSALSLYRMEKQGATSSGRRGINFLAGDVIELTFAEGDLELAEVDGLRKGIFLDPAPEGGRSADTTARREGG